MARSLRLEFPGALFHVTSRGNERRTTLLDDRDFQSFLDLLGLAVKRFRWIRFKIRCPVSPAHRVQLWNDPGKCPKCGVYVEKNALPFRLWE